jgi:glycosyltransferase involved in cell wall biosynthesis
MRIAFVTNRPAHYRVPTFEQLANYHDVDFLFTAAKPGRWWSARHKTDPKALGGTYATAGGLYRLLTGSGYDAVVGCLGGRTHLAAMAAAVARSRIPFVLWVDMWFYPRSLIHAAGRPLTRYLLRRADSVVSCGVHVSRWIADEVGRTDAVFEMPNAVDNDHFGRPVAPRELSQFRDRYGLDGVIASFVGRLEPEKGLDVLLRAVAAARQPFDVVLAGEGSLEKPLADLSAALDISERVRFIGWVEQQTLPTLYQASDVFVFPSVSTRLVKETWGLAVNEAMSAGLPVIATDAVGAAAGGLVEDGVTGWVVPEKNAIALSRALDEAVSKPKMREKHGNEARRRAGEYTFEAGTDAFAAAVDHAVAVRGRTSDAA